jgi:hypothetical protein
MDLVEFKINDYISLKLEHRNTVLYVDGERFNQCRSLFLKSTDVTNIPDYIENFRSIDEEEVKLSPKNPSTKIPPETEFWAHCSNLQAWSENGYNSRLLHRNLAFPLLKKLTEVGDVKAKRIFKEEIAKRLHTGYPTVVVYLIREGYTQFLKGEELFYAVITEEEAEILLELEKSLTVENKKHLWLAIELEHELAPCFIVQNRHVVGLDLFECGLKKLPESISDLKYLQILSARYNRLEKLPESLKNLPDLKEIHVDNNKIKYIPSSLKYLIK